MTARGSCGLVDCCLRLLRAKTQQQRSSAATAPPTIKATIAPLPMLMPKIRATSAAESSAGDGEIGGDGGGEGVGGASCGKAEADSGEWGLLRRNGVRTANSDGGGLGGNGLGEGSSESGGGSGGGTGLGDGGGGEGSGERKTLLAGSALQASIVTASASVLKKLEAVAVSTHCVLTAASAVSAAASACRLIVKAICTLPAMILASTAASGTPASLATFWRIPVRPSVETTSMEEVMVSANVTAYVAGGFVGDGGDENGGVGDGVGGVDGIGGQSVAKLSGAAAWAVVVAVAGKQLGRNSSRKTSCYNPKGGAFSRDKI